MRVADLKPMKFCWAAREDWTRLVDSDEWVFEQKCDGMRLLVTVAEGECTFNLRSTAAMQWYPALREMFAHLTGEYVLDGELMCGTGEYVLFDLPFAPVLEVGPETTLQARREALERFVLEVRGFEPAAQEKLRIVSHTTGREKKEALLTELRDAGAEGVVAKRLGSAYRTDGIRSVDWLKLKFTKTAEVIVVERNSGTACNARLAMMDAGAARVVGACSMIGKPEARVGDVIEVKYLYATKGLFLYQPTMLRVREDRQPATCLIEQLVPVNRKIF